MRARAVHGGRAPEHFRALAAAQLAVSLRDPFNVRLGALERVLPGSTMRTQ